MRAPRLLAAGFAWLAGCSFGARVDGARFHCGGGEECPPGLSCVGGFCQAEVDAGGSGDDGGDAVDGPCGTMSLLADDFEDGIDPDRFAPFSDPGTSVAESGGQLAIEFAGSGSGEVWGGVRSSLRYRLRGGELRVEVAQVGGAYTVLEVRPFEGAKAQLLVEDQTTLRATLIDAPGGTVEIDEEYRADLHRFWRLREEGGDIHFETAADHSPARWHQVAVWPIPFESDEVEVLLSAAGRAGDPSARFGSLNRDLPAAAGYCPASELSDGFEAPPFAPIWWSWADDGCSIAETGGALAVSFTAPGSVWCGADSFQLFDLTESAVQVAIDPPSPESSQVVVGLWAYHFDDADTFVHMVREGGSIVFRRSGPEGSGESSEPYSAEDRYFRLSGAGGRVLGATSADGRSWQTLFDAEPPFDLSAVQVSLQGGLGVGASAEGDRAVVLGVNAD